VEDSQKTQGNIDVEKEKIDFASLHIYHDFDTMLAEETLDAVSITLPTFLHADFTVKALEAGVSVLCEKPMALTAADCDRMIAAARSSGKKLQIGHCIRFWSEYVAAKEIIDSKKYGPLLAASFRRYGSMPTWGDNWFADDSRSGGMILDLHIHDVDYVQYLLGMPKSVTSFGVKNTHNSIVHVASRYEYDNQLITAEGGWAMMPSFVFEMSFTLVLEKATVLFNSRNNPAFQVFPDKGDAYTPELLKEDGYIRQVNYFANELKGKSQQQVITLEQSRNSIVLIEAEKQSIQTEKKVVL
jgi:predicted dehydrogenase